MMQATTNPRDAGTQTSGQPRRTALGRNELDLDAFAGSTYTVEAALAEVPARFRGKRVALVGPVPRVAEVARALIRRGADVTLFDPAIPWVLPPAARALPADQQLRAARLYLRAAVRDAWLRDRMTPRGEASRAQPRFVKGFHALFTRDGCDFVSWPLARVTPIGLSTADGVVTRADIIVYDASIE